MCAGQRSFLQERLQVNPRVHSSPFGNGLRTWRACMHAHMGIIALCRRWRLTWDLVLLVMPAWVPNSPEKYAQRVASVLIDKAGAVSLTDREV